MTTASKLKRFHLHKYADVQDAMSDAVSGNDLYPRTKRTMTHGQADTHVAAVFNMPRAMVRRRRTFIGRIMGWLRLM